MQLKHFYVGELFGHFDHRVEFPTSPDEEGGAAPSIVILHGPNGVGKTTILRMLDGLMRLDFDVFREVPFKECRLEFDNQHAINVAPTTSGEPRGLDVTFDQHAVVLDARRGRKGALREEEAPVVDAFRSHFFDETSDISFEYISTIRRPDPFADDELRMAYVAGVDQPIHIQRQRRPERAQLAEKVADFVRRAQLDYRRFFATTEPELFPRIMQRLLDETNSQATEEALTARLSRIQNREQMLDRLGLQVEQWDYERLMGYLRSGAASPRHEYALAVLAGYTDVLESRAEQRQLVADRLLTFENILNDFLLDKTVSVQPEKGLVIDTPDGHSLSEDQLSSGEYHLLYLMVAALVTRRRGTVIAIDEPEMSMHIAWQRKLIANLLRCASNAAPQFVFATHSPDIVGDYREYLVEIAPADGNNAATSS